MLAVQDLGPMRIEGEGPISEEETEQDRDPSVLLGRVEITMVETTRGRTHRRAAMTTEEGEMQAREIDLRGIAMISPSTPTLGEKLMDLDSVITMTGGAEAQTEELTAKEDPSKEDDYDDDHFNSDNN